MAERRIDIKITLGGTAGRDAAELERKITDTFKDIGAEVHVASEEVDEFGDRGKRGMEKFGAGTVAAGNLLADFVKGGLRQLQQFAGDVFEKTLDYRRVRATVQNLGADIGAIEGSLKTFDAAWGDQTELMSTYFQLHSGGITDTSEALEALRGTAKLAFGEAAEMSTVAAAGIKAVNVYGGEFSDTLEQISMMAKLGDTNLEAIASSIPTVLETAKGLNVSLADVGGATAVLTQKFRSAQQSTMYLDAWLRSMTMGSDQAAKAAKDLGIEWSADALISRGLTGYIEYLADALERSGKSKGEVAELLQKLTGSAEASRGLKALIGSVDELGTAIENTGKSAGRIEEVEQNMQAAIGPAERLTNALANMEIQIGEGLAPAAAKIIELLNEMLPTISEFANGITTTVKDVLRLAEEITKAFKEIEEGWASLPEPLKLILATPGALADLAGKAIEGSASTGVVGAVLGRAELYAEHMSKLYEDLNVKLGSGGIGGQATAQIGGVFAGAAQGADELTKAVTKLTGAESELTKEQIKLLETYGGLDYKIGLVKDKYDELEVQARAMGAGQEVLTNLIRAESDEITKLVEADRKLQAAQDQLTGGTFWDYVASLITQQEHWLSSTEDLNEEIRKHGDELGIVDEQVDMMEDSVEGLAEAEQNLREHLEETNFSLNDMVAYLGQLSNSLQIAGALASSFGFGDISKYFQGLQGMQSGVGLWQEALKTDDAGNALYSGLTAGWMKFNALLSIGGGIVSTVAALWKAFSGPTNEELIAGAGEQAGKIFGEAFSAEVQAVMERVAYELPRAASGKVNVMAAMWHPDVIAAVLSNIESVNTASLEDWAGKLEDHVRSVLGNTLGYSEQMQADLMGPLFDQLIALAVESGAVLGSEFQRMLGWAQKLGYEIKVTGEDLVDTFLALLDAEELDIEALQDMGLLAEQLGVTLDDAFAAAQDRVIELRKEWKAFGEQIEDAARKVEDLIISRWQWQTWTLPAATREMGAWAAEQGAGFTYERPGGLGLEEWQPWIEAATFTGADAWAAVQDDLREMTAGWTELLTAAEYEEIMGRLGSAEAQQKLDEWYEVKSQGIKLTEQIHEARRAVRLLEKARDAARVDWRIAHRRLQDAKEALNSLDRTMPRKLDIVHSDLRDIFNAIRAIPSRQSGGYIPDAGLYQLHRGEFVLPSGVALPGSAGTGGGVVHHTPIVINLDGGRQAEGTIISEGRVVEIVWDQLEHSDKEIPAHRVRRN